MSDDTGSREASAATTGSHEHKSAKDRLLDLLVFGPAGLAMTAADEFPHLVAKGRHRIEGQVHTARLIGQVAVQMGRSQIEQTVSGWVGQRAGTRPASSPAAPASAPPAPAPRAPRPSVPAPSAGTSAAAAGNGSIASTALGIPGYDSLSASQVVQRLGGLSQTELLSVQAHEVAHRHRRTILNRVEQLRAGAGPDGG